MSDDERDWYPVTDDFRDAPDGARITWPEFGPGEWERHGPEWVRGTVQDRL